MEHEITPEELIEMTIFTKENNDSIHVKSLSNALSGYRDVVEDQLDHKYFDALPGDNEKDKDISMAKNILDCLTEAGYVIVNRHSTIRPL